MKVTNIDVTLRDGGYRNRFRFDEGYAIRHVHNIAQSGIEWIEIGYRNGSFTPIKDIGITGLSPDSYIRTVRDRAVSARLCVMAHPKNVSSQEIVKIHGLGIELVRFCMDNHNSDLTWNCIKTAKDCGLLVSLNLTRVSQQPLKQLITNAELARAAGADVLYLADSNGSLTPSKVANLVRTMADVSNLDIGFHAHDNLGLAMSNSIAAFEAGATYMDASLRGMGKGAGNLKLELWLGYLFRNQKVEKYDHGVILDQIDDLVMAERLDASERPSDDLILGMFDLSIDEKERIFSNVTNNSLALARARDRG
ncbi:MAG TPA: hypothetical protein VHL08_08420 [Dongiaceae bacterium]|jgi:4-hydroxy 2-oxovalerate aldolase|nr:hypothetical protein [Dongiaceae bacterium]